MAKRVAVFVDGDNLAATHADTLNAEASRYGTVFSHRVYGTENALSNWRDTAKFQFIYAGCTKNAADMLIALDAMDMAHAGQMDVAVLCSSDSDFTHLARRLRERGLSVIGIGQAKSTMSWRSACCTFHSLPSTQPDKTAQPCAKSPNVAPTPKATALKPTDLDQKIKALIDADPSDKKGMAYQTAASVFTKAFPGTLKSLQKENWRAYLKTRPTLFHIDAKGPNARVRVKPSGFQ